MIKNVNGMTMYESHERLDTSKSCERIDKAVSLDKMVLWNFYGKPLRKQFNLKAVTIMINDKTMIRQPSVILKYIQPLSLDSAAFLVSCFGTTASSKTKICADIGKAVSSYSVLMSIELYIIVVLNN